jgi:hypothetical protein
VEIFELLNNIKKRPSLYLGGNSINHLKAFLDGYYFCKHSFELSNSLQDQLWFTFQQWIEKKYSIKTSQSWAQIILFFSTDECEALKKFFELWEEFMNNQHHIG